MSIFTYGNVLCNIISVLLTIIFVYGRNNSVHSLSFNIKEAEYRNFGQGPVSEKSVSWLNENLQEDVQLRFLTKLRRRRDIHKNDFHILEIQRPFRSNSTITVHVTKSENLVSSNFTYKVHDGERLRSDEAGVSKQFGDLENSEVFMQTSSESSQYESLEHCIYSGISSSSSEDETTNDHHNVALSACSVNHGFTGIITTKEGTYLSEPASGLNTHQFTTNPRFEFLSAKVNNLEHQIPHTLTLLNPSPEGSATCVEEIYGKETNDETSLHHTSINVESEISKNLELTSKLNKSLTKQTFHDIPTIPKASNSNSKKILAYKKFDRKRSKKQKNRILELALFADESFIKQNFKKLRTKSEKTIKNLMLLLAQVVANLYRSPSLETTIDIVVVHLELFIKNPATINTHHGKFKDYLPSFCKYAASLNSDNSKWDHAMLLTGLDLRADGLNAIVGVAYTGALCTVKNSCSLIEAVDFQAPYTMTHELGHSIGMRHDGEAENSACSKSAYIMGPVASFTAHSWSTCSNKNMNGYLNKLEKGYVWRSKADCLFTKTTSDSEEGKYTFSSKLPGEKYNPDEQCKMHNAKYNEALTHSLGALFEFKTGKPYNMCRSLFCSNKSKWSARQLPHAALEGSECETGKWCRNWECVEKEE